MRSSGDVLGIPGSEIATIRKTASDVRVKKWVGAVSVVFKLAHQNTLAEAADAVSSVAVSPTGFPDPTSVVTIVEDDIFEED